MTLDALKASLADRYRIERELGAGGMATVYLAEDLRHTRKVAIKVLREDLAASLGSTRFLREIQIAAQLQHPNILPLLDSGEAHGPDGSGPYLFYVMPFVPGQSLRERLARDGELPVHEAVRLLVEVTDALAHSHQMGVVHRDIKPDNVMMSGRHALVTDFGVAKAISEATGRNTVTTLGVAVGTPTYMSPEQASADPHIDHRSDIYAVGVMAYEMLTGRPPFTGATPQQVLAAHVTEAPDPVSKRRPAIPAPLEQIVMRCLAKRPADRFQTAEELLQLLEAQATPSTGITPTQTRPVTAWGDPVRRRRWMLPAAIAILALGTVGFFTLRGGRASEPEMVTATRTQVTFTGSAEFTSALSPDGQRVAYADRRCGDNYDCTYDVVVQDIGGRGSSRVVRNMPAIYELRWSGDGRTLLMGGLQAAGQLAYYSVPALGGEAPRLVSSSAVRLFGTGDSALIGTLATPGRLVLRATTLANPTRGDSLVIERPGVQSFQWGVSPGGRWISVGVQTGSDRFGVLMDRRGQTLDSVTANDVQAAGFIADDRLVLGFADSNSPGLLRLVERRLRNDGHLDPVVHEVTGQIPGVGLSFGAQGISYLDGTTQAKVIAISRGTDINDPIRTREVASSTGFLGALMGSDGNFIILERRDPADPAANRLSVQPFEGGSERIIAGSQLTNERTRSRTVDGKGLVVLSRNGASVNITEYDLATGEGVARGTLEYPGDIIGLEAMADGSLAWQPDGQVSSISIRSPSGEIRTVVTPQVHTEGLEDSPNGHGLIGWGFSLPNYDSLVVYHVAPGASEGRPLVRAVFDFLAGYTWLPDGNVQLVLNETLATSAFYHLDMATGVLTRQGTIPLNFINSISFSNDGRRLSAITLLPTLDVWTIRWQ